MNKKFVVKYLALLNATEAFDEALEAFQKARDAEVHQVGGADSSRTSKKFDDEVEQFQSVRDYYLGQFFVPKLK